MRREFDSGRTLLRWYDRANGAVETENSTTVLGTDRDLWQQNVWHTYFIDTLALRHYAAIVGGTQVTHDFAHDARFNHTAVFDTS